MTTSILDKAKDLIKAIEDNTNEVDTIPLQYIVEELEELKEWVKEGKLEERIIN